MPDQEAAKKEVNVAGVINTAIDNIRTTLQKFDGDVLSSCVQEITQSINSFDPDFQQPAVEHMPWSPINDKARTVAMRLDPEVMTVGQYLNRGYVEQTVFLNEHVNVTFRSARNMDGEFLSAWSSLEAEAYDKVKKSQDITDDDMIVLLNATNASQVLNDLALSIVRVNGEPLAGVADVYVLNEKLGIEVPQLANAKKKKAALSQLPDALTNDFQVLLHLFLDRVVYLHAPESVRSF